MNNPYRTAPLPRVSYWSRFWSRTSFVFYLGRKVVKAVGGQKWMTVVKWLAKPIVAAALLLLVVSAGWIVFPGISRLGQWEDSYLHLLPVTVTDQRVGGWIMGFISLMVVGLSLAAAHSILEYKKR